jgi:nitrogen-specific signal transduction histidine kinase/HAMP domain-containing protein
MKHNVSSSLPLSCAAAIVILYSVFDIPLHLLPGHPAPYLLGFFLLLSGIVALRRTTTLMKAHVGLKVSVLFALCLSIAGMSFSLIETSPRLRTLLDSVRRERCHARLQQKIDFLYDGGAWAIQSIMAAETGDNDPSSRFALCRKVLHRFEGRTRCPSGGIEIFESGKGPVAWCGWLPSSGDPPPAGIPEPGSGWRIGTTQIFEFLHIFDSFTTPSGSLEIVSFYYPLALNPLFLDTFSYVHTYRDRIAGVFGDTLRFRWKTTSSAAGSLTTPLIDENIHAPEKDDERIGNLRERIHRILLNLFLLTLIPVFLHAFYRDGAKSSPEKSLTRNIALFLLFFIVRSAFLLLRFPWFLIDAEDISTSAVYTTDLAFGFFRSPGDLFLSSLFILIYILLIFPGRIAPVRTKSSSPPVCSTGGRRPADLWVLTAVPVAFLLYIQHRIIADIAATVPFHLFRTFPFESPPVDFMLAFSMVNLTSAALLAVLMWFSSFLHFSMKKGRTKISAAIGFLLLISLTLIPALKVNPSLFWLFIAGSFVIGIWAALSRSKTTMLITGGILISLLCSAEYSENRMTVLTHAIEKHALDAIEHPLQWIHFFLETTLEDLARDEELIDALDGASTDALELKAFSLWAQTDLKYVGTPSILKIIDRYSHVADKFSMNMIADPKEENTHYYHGYMKNPELTVLHIPEEELGKDISLLSGMIPLKKKDIFLGSLILSLPLKKGIPLYETSPQRLLRGQERYRPLLVKPFPYSEITVRPVAGRAVTSPPAADGTRFRYGFTGSGNVEEWAGRWLTEDGQGKKRFLLSAPPEGRSKAFLIEMDSRIFDTGVFFNCLVYTTALCLFAALLFILYSPSAEKGQRVRFRGRWKFRDKIFALLLTVSVLIIIFWGIFSAGITRVEMNRSYASENRKTAFMVKNAIERQLLHEAVKMSEHPGIHDYIIEDLTLAADFLEETDKNILIYDAGAEEIARFGTVPAISPAIVARTIDSSVKHLFYQKTDEDLYLVAVVPVKIRPSARLNLGVFVLTQKTSSDFCKTVAGDLQIDFTLFRNRTVYASSRMEFFRAEFFNTRLSGAVYRDLFLENRDLSEKDDEGGYLHHRTTCIPLNNEHGVCTGVLSVPSLAQEVEIEARIRKIFSYVAGSVILWTGLIILIGKAFSGKISSPLAALIQGTRSVARGKFEYRVRTHASDEIQELIDSFNIMTRYLKEYSDNLHYQRTMLSTIVSNIADGVLAVSAENLIVSLNPRACEILGISDKWLNRSIQETTGNQVLQYIANHIESAAKAPGIDEFEVTRGTEKGESIIKVSITRIPGKKRPGLPEILVVLEEITELVQSKKWIAWGEMAKQVAHEVKNPLTPMKLSAQYLKKAFLAGHENFQDIFHRSIDVIITQINHLDRLVRDFSLVARTAAPVPQKVDMVRIIESLCRSYEGLALEGIVLKHDIEDDLHPVMGVEEEILKILYNIMENAAQAIQGEGTIGITARNVREKGTPSKDGIEIIIQDDGEGIPPENMHRLFQPEFSTKSYGTGLGLFISKNLVEKHDGEITLASTPGKGTSVTVHLPAKKRER